MNPHTPSLVLAALLSVTPALAAPGSSSAQVPVSATTLTATSGASESQAYASSSAQSPRGTGHLFAGGYLGLLANNGVAPNIGLEVAGPIPVAGLPPSLHLEWTGALDLWFRSDSAGAGNFQVDASVFNIGVIPGGRIVVPVLPEVLLHGDLGLGLALTHVSVDSNFAGAEASDTDFGLVFRLAAGAIIPLSEKVRLDVAPLGLQTYTSGGGTAFSMRLGLSVALD